MKGYDTGMFESSVKLVWSPILKQCSLKVTLFESSVKLVWSPMAAQALLAAE